MTRSYEDSTAKRRAKLGADAREQTQVFEQAYAIAMQVVALREEHGLTQSQLAERAGMDQADVIHGGPGADAIFCGPGTDKAYADGADRVRRCERVG